MAACVPTLGGVSDFGNMKMYYGTYTASGATPGTLSLNSPNIFFCKACSSIGAKAIAIGWASGTLTITPVASDTAGYWSAYGF